MNIKSRLEIIVCLPQVLIESMQGQLKCYFREGKRHDASEKGITLANRTWQRVLQQNRKCKKVSDSCDSYDLTISIKKIEVVYQPAPGKPYKESTIAVKGQQLQVVDKFTYLGSTLSRVVHIDDEVNARIAKASAAFGQVRGSIWD